MVKFDHFCLGVLVSLMFQKEEGLASVSIFPVSNNWAK